MKGGSDARLCQLDIFSVFAHLDVGFAVSSKNKNAAGSRFTHGVLGKKT